MSMLSLNLADNLVKTISQRMSNLCLMIESNKPKFIDPLLFDQLLDLNYQMFLCFFETRITYLEIGGSYL